MENPQNNKNKPELNSDLKDAWDLAGMYRYPESQHDDQAWAKLKSHIDRPALKVQRNTRQIRLWRIAAAVALITASGAAFWSVLKPGDVVTEAVSHAESTMKGQMKTISLPDGSKVILNGGSSIEIGPDFGQQNRNIRLQGQAFFEVARNEKIPFVVKAGTLNVTVLGTGFDIRAYHDGKPSVRVAHGKVRVSNGKDEAVLTEGMAVEINDENKLVNAGAETVSWNSGNLIFSAATLTEVAQAVKNRFNINLTFDAKDSNRQFTGKFPSGSKAEDIETILGQAMNIDLRAR